LRARRRKSADFRVQQAITVHRILAIAVRRGEALLDPALGRQNPGNRGGSLHPVIEGRQEERGHSAAGPPGSADAVAINIVASAKIIQRAPGIQQFDR